MRKHFFVFFDGFWNPVLAWQPFFSTHQYFRSPAVPMSVLSLPCWLPILLLGRLFPSLLTSGFSFPPGSLAPPWNAVLISSPALQQHLSFSNFYLCLKCFSYWLLWLLLTTLTLEVFLVISSRSQFTVHFPDASLVPSSCMSGTAWFLPQVFRSLLTCHFCLVLHHRLAFSICFLEVYLLQPVQKWGTHPVCGLGPCLRAPWLWSCVV